MYLFTLGDIDTKAKPIITQACAAYNINLKSLMRVSAIAPLKEGPMGIWRNAVEESVSKRIAQEMETLDALEPKEAIGIVIGGFGNTVSPSRFSLAQRILERKIDTPIIVIESPTSLSEVTRFYGGIEKVTSHTSTDPDPSRVNIITNDEKMSDRLRELIALCARRASAS